MWSIHQAVALIQLGNKQKRIKQLIWGACFCYLLGVQPAVATDLKKTPAKAPRAVKEERLKAEEISIKSELERRRKRLIMFTVGERKQLAMGRIQRALELTENLYKRTTDPDLKFKLSIKLARMYMQKSENLTITAEAKYEKELEDYLISGKDVGLPPPVPPTYEQARSLENKAVRILEASIPIAEKAEKDDSLYFLGRIYTNRGEFHKAVPYFSRVLNDYPESEYTWESKLMVAENYFLEAQFQSALKLYEELIAERSSEPYPLYKKAWTLFNLRRYSESIDLFLSLYRQARSEAQRGEAGVLQDIGRQIVDDMVVVFADSDRIGQGISFFDKLAPSAASYRNIFKMAKVLNNEGKYSLARQVCDHLFNRYPQTPIIPSVILTYLETYLEFVHDVQRYHAQLTQVLDEKLTAYPPASLAQSSTLAATSVVELESFIARKGKNLHSEGQKLYAKYSQAEKKDKRLKVRAESALSSGVKYYEIYLRHFGAWPQAKHTLEIGFYLGELHFQLDRFQQAADAYIRVVKMRRQAKSPTQKQYVQEALYGAVVSYDKLLGLKETKAKKPKGDVSTLVPFSSQESHFLQIATVYLNEMKGHSAYQQITYRVAKLYYDHNYFKEAVPLFWETIRTNPTTKLARFGGDLILDAYNAQKDFGSLVQSGQQLLAIHNFGDAKYKSGIQKLIDGAKFKTVEKFEASKDYEAAAQAYMQLGKGGEVSAEMGEMALHNAAINFIKAKQWPNAIRAYKQLIDNFPKSKFSKDALLTLAEYHQYFGNFKDSQDAYIQYLQTYPDKSAATINVVFQVAFVAETLGDYPTAIQYYKKYLTLKPRASDRSKVTIRMCASAAQISRGNLAEIRKTYAQSAKLEAKIRCRFENIKLQLNAGQDVSKPLLGLKNNLKKFVPVYERDALTKYFRTKVDRLERQYSAKRLVNIPPEQSGPILKEKLNILKKMEALSNEISDYGVVSALFDVLRTQALTYIDLGEDMLAAPVPANLAGADRDTYVAQIAKIANPLRDKGVANLKRLMEQAGELQVVDPTLPSIWRQYNAVQGKYAKMPEWLTSLELMPYYLPTTKGRGHIKSFFPPVLFEGFSVAKGAATLPDLASTDIKTKTYYELLTLIGRADYRQAWSKLMPAMMDDLKNPYLLNVLAFLKAKSNQPREALLVLQLAQKLKENSQEIFQILQINHALLTLQIGKKDEGIALLEQLRGKHVMAGMLLGYLAIQSFNFFWARSIYYNLPKAQFQEQDKLYAQLGDAISKWGTLDSEAAIRGFQALQREADRSVLVVSLPLAAALLTTRGKGGLSDALSMIASYKRLRDTHRDRKDWVNQLESDIRGLQRVKATK